MALITTPSETLPGIGTIDGTPPYPFSGLLSLPGLGASLRDLRIVLPTTAQISDRVMFKATPSSPESPFAQGRVWLLRLADGYKAWEGFSNAAGYYTATGLEVGVDYIAVGIDPLRNQKATGAGPVRAVEAP